MLKAKDFRHAAWEKLHGKWGTMAIAALIYSLIMVACGFLSYIYIGWIATLLLAGAFVLGLSGMALLVSRGLPVRTERLFDGFKNYGSSLALYLLIAIFTFLWTLLLIVPGIVKAYSYSMSYFILCDDPQLPANQARKRSMELMRGNKWRLFCLHFSFIGWFLLCLLTLGILSFWIIPYLYTAQAEFYRSLITEPAPAAGETQTDGPGANGGEAQNADSPADQSGARS